MSFKINIYFTKYANIRKNKTKIDHVFKILLIGDAGVGKSSILLQFTDGYFNDNLQSTIGNAHSKYFLVLDRQIDLYNKIYRHITRG